MTQFFGFKKEIWLTLFLLFLFEFGHGFAVIIEDENPLVDLSNGEEFRKMAGYGEERLSTVLVTGSVLCEACLHAESQLHAWPVSGAVVGINCHNTGKKTKSSDWVHGVTDEFGDFIIDIPSHLHALHSFEKSCYIKILRYRRTHAANLLISPNINEYNYHHLEAASEHILQASLSCSTKHLNPCKLV